MHATLPREPAPAPTASPWRAIGLILAALLLPPRTAADVPLPAFTFYGEVRNAYGWPYTRADQAEVIVRVDGRECGRAAVDEQLGSGLNYRVEVPLDDGQGALYAAFATRTGARPSFVIRVGNTEFVGLDATNAPAVGAPGDRLRLDFFRDNDADRDGLPDTWEQLILIASHGALTNVSQVRPADDFDRDGVDNRDEFLAGTDPTWAVDRLALESVVYLPEANLLGLGFYSVRAKSYELYGADSPGAWQPTPFSLNATNLVFQPYWRGDGFYSWFFVDTRTNAHRLLRLRAQ